jgi:MFS family permease
MLVVFLVVFVDLLGFGIVLPLLPLFGKSYVAPLFPEGSPLVGAVVGLLMASFSAMQFVFLPVWGRISDRIGRRPVLLIGLAGSVFFYALLGVALTMPTEHAAWGLTLLFISRIGAGISGATIGTAQAVIADTTTPERRKVGMSMIGAAFGIGFTFGPLIGAACRRWGKNMPELVGYSAAGLSFLALLLGLLLLRETRVFGTTAPFRRLIDVRAINYVLGHPALAPVILVFFLASLGFGGFETTLALINQNTLKLEEDTNFLLFAFVGFVLVLAQGGLYRPLARRFSETTFMTLGIILMGLGVLGVGGLNVVAYQGYLSQDERITWLLTSTTFAVIGFAFLTPSAQALISRRADPERQGEILGVNQATASLARILGPILWLSLYELTADHLLPYLLGGGLVLVMLPMMGRVERGGARVDSRH